MCAQIASAAVHSKVEVILLWGFSVWSLFYCAIISLGKRELVSIAIVFGCNMTARTLCFVLTVPWAGLHCVIAWMKVQNFQNHELSKLQS